MKITVLFVLFCSISLLGQFDQLRDKEGNIGGGFGMTWIDEKPHYTFHIFPELALGNIGFGLDLNLEFDSEGNLRNENFNEFSDYLSIIRYFRYGQKNDPTYFRVGALDYATLGHGSLMYLYNNSPSYDTRRIGAVLDLDFNAFGFESVYSNFMQQGIIGLRGFVRPFIMAEMDMLPFISNMEIGATYINDFDENANVKSLELNGNELVPLTDGSMSAFGFDLGIPLLRNMLVDIDFYVDYGNIVGYGDGVSTGFLGSFKGLGLVNIQAKLERRFNNDKYIPAYFNSFYEIDRFYLNQSTGEFNSKAFQLENTVNSGNGFYGEIFVSVLGMLDIRGSYQRLDKEPKSGIFHASTNIAPEESPYVVRAGYDKVRIEDEADLFTLDDRSYLYVEAGYKPMQYILVSLVYNWTFTPLRDTDDNVIGYEPQKKIEPRVSFIYPIGL